MAHIRDLTPDEHDLWRAKSHERRTADTFGCPHCGSDSGISANVAEPAIIDCYSCGQPYFAWTAPGTIHISAKR